MSTTQQQLAVRQYEQKILAICKRFPDGVPELELKNEFANQNIRMIAMNNLLQQGRVRMYKEGTSIIYREVSQEEAALFSGMSPEDITVYEIIKEAGNKGEWLKNIKYRSKLQPKQITTSLKKLRSKDLIKPVKTIHGKTKIVYMLSNLEPSREITGGVWYVGTDFNTNLITELQTATCTYLFQKKHCTTKEALEFVKGKGISDIELGLEDMQSIIDTLVYDGLIERVIDPRDQSQVAYKPIGVVTPENAFSAIPCSTCPVFDQCTENGDINPQTCVYLKQWLLKDLYPDNQVNEDEKPGFRDMDIDF
jgi:DNA-directed RNA polymerase III subunit RPC6